MKKVNNFDRKIILGIIIAGTLFLCTMLGILFIKPTMKVLDLVYQDKLVFTFKYDEYIKLTDKEIKESNQFVSTLDPSYDYYWCKDEEGTKKVNLHSYYAFKSSKLYLHKVRKDIEQVTILNNTFVYDEIVKTIELGFSSNDLSLNDFKVTYYLNNKEIAEPINAGEYDVTIHYLGSKYKINDVNTKLIIEKRTPVIDTLLDNINVNKNTTLKDIDLSMFSSNISGTFTFIDSLDTVVENKEYEVKFTPYDSVNFTEVILTIKININE